MKTNREFKKALYRAYEGSISLDHLIKSQEQFLRGLAQYALRYKTEWYLSDEDDLFQEACIWLIKSMWSWDEKRNISLYKYVVYNIGARLKMQVEHERTQRRHPTAKKLSLNKSYSKKGHVINTTPHQCNRQLHEHIKGIYVNQETYIALQETIESANKKLTRTARDLLFALIMNNGNMSDAINDMADKKYIRKKYGDNKEFIRYVLTKTKTIDNVLEFSREQHI